MFNDTASDEPIGTDFFDQFEPDGRDFLYRLDWRGRGVRVSAEERDAFVEQYKSHGKWLGRLQLGVIILWICSSLFLWSQKLDPRPWHFGLLLGIVICLDIARGRLWTEPARTLRDRPQEGEDRSPSKAARLTGRLESWPRLTMILLIAAPLAYLGISSSDPGKMMFWVTAYWTALAMIYLAKGVWLRWQADRQLETS